MNKHKRGDTWRYIHVADIRDTLGALVNLTGWTLKSQLRRHDVLIAELVCTWTNVGAQEFQTYFASTSTWELGRLDLDVQFTSGGGDVVSWPTIAVEIVPDITRP